MVVVAADPGDQALELAEEAAAVRKIDQAVLVREMVQLLDALLKLRNLAAQPPDLLDEPIYVLVFANLVRHCPRACQF